jgi:hypothetical protein
MVARKNHRRIQKRSGTNEKVFALIDARIRPSIFFFKLIIEQTRAYLWQQMTIHQIQGK